MKYLESYKLFERVSAPDLETSSGKITKLDRDVVTGGARKSMF